MRSSRFFFIAVSVVRVTPIPAFLEPGEAELFSNNLVSEYTDDNLELSFAPSSADLYFIPDGDTDMGMDIWGPDLEEEPGSEPPYLDNFDFDSTTNFDLLVSSEPFRDPDIQYGDWDDYISDPLAKCPLNNHRYAACCGELLSENRYIPDCTPSKKASFPPLSLGLWLFSTSWSLVIVLLINIAKKWKRLSREFLSATSAVFLLLQARHGESH